MSAMKVYRYGLRAPVQREDLVRRSIRVAHDYRNQLVELERKRRERMRQLDTLATEQLRRRVEACREAVEQAVAEMRREKSRTRKRSTPAEMRERVAAAKAALREATAAWKDERARARQDEAAQRERDKINEWWLAERRRLRPGLSSRADGVAAGTYQLVEDADAKARADLPLWDQDQPADPRFRRWTGEGTVSVQIVGGVSVRAMLDGASTQVRVTDRQDARDPKTSRRAREKRRCDLWLRVGSNEDRSPIWAVWPMVMHRPLPEGGRIKRVSVVLRKVGPREEWCAQFVVDEPQAAPACGEGSVGIDVGWRQMADGRVRVAMTHEGDEITLPAGVIGGMRKVEDLRSIRDKNFEAAKAELARWLGERDGGIRCWIDDHVTHLHQWRAPGKLAALVLRWRDQRVEGDAEILERLETWRRQDRHLWLWETSERASSLRERRDHYRNEAAKLARRYETCVLEKFDLREVAKRERDAEERPNESARSMRFLVSVSEFRDCLRNAFASRGGRVVEVPAEHTTTTCADCGTHVEFDAATMLRAVCPNGHEWDQDQNAARNIRERWSGEPEPGAARSPDEPMESRRERVRRKRQEKLDRMDRSKDVSDDAAASEVA